MSKNKLLAQLETKVEAKGAVVTHSEPESVSGQIPFTCMADPQFQMRGGFKNPMVDAAMPLFGMVMRVLKLDALPNIVEVRKLVHIQITAIEQEMQQHPYNPVQPQAYSYSLCLYIDEAVMSRPWGKNSVWSERPLLSDFHQETQGGEKVFSVLQGMMQEPKRFKDVLEFMYYCMCLGLKGKYAIEPRGEESLQCLIMDLYAIIRELRGPVGASYVDQVVARYGGNSVTGKGAAATLGRLKLWGASLAGIGGLVLSWWDFADWKDHYTENRHGPTPQSRRRSSVIATAYAARGVATISLSLAELGTAIAIAKPFFDYLTLTSENKLIRILASTMSELSASLGSQTARLLLARLVLGAFWIGLAITVLIIIFDDDALEKWCKQSIYRSNRAHNKVLAEKIELKALFSALRGVI